MKSEFTKRCVIADDVRASREMLGAWLNEWEYACTLVADGEAARIAAEAERPNLIITDIEMPRCNGLELLTALRSHAKPELRTVPTIIISSLRDSQLLELVSQFGASCVLSKPLEKLSLKGIVTAIESRHGLSSVISQAQWRQDIKQIPAVSPKLRRMVEEIMRDKL